MTKPSAVKARPTRAAAKKRGLAALLPSSGSECDESVASEEEEEEEFVVASPGRVESASDEGDEDVLEEEELVKLEDVDDLADFLAPPRSRAQRAAAASATPKRRGTGKPQLAKRPKKDKKEEEYDEDDDEEEEDGVMVEQEAEDEQEGDEKPELKLFTHQQEGVRRILRGWLEDKYVAKEVKVDMLGRHDDAEYTLKRCFAHLNFDEMGLGKTIQSLEALHRMLQQGKLEGPTLIVAPPPCIGVWVTEINTYFGDSFIVSKFVDGGACEKTLAGLSNRHVVITTYPVLTNCFTNYVRDEYTKMSDDDLLRFVQIMGHATAEARSVGGKFLRADLQSKAAADIAKIKTKGLKNQSRLRAYKKLMSTRFGVSIFDEIQKCKTVGAKVTRAVAMVDTQYRLGLSGTPIMNSGKEMITLLKYGLCLIDADYFTIGREPDGKYTRDLLRTISLGRLKKDLPEVQALLPTRDRDAETVIVEWNEDPHAVFVYQTIRDASLKALEDANNLEPRRADETTNQYQARRLGNQSNFWASLSRLRTVCLHRDVPQYSLDANYQPSIEWPDWTFRTHKSFPLWFQVKAFTVHLCLRRLYGNLVNRDMRRLICANLAVAEQHVIQPSPKMLKFLELYRDMERTHPDNLKMVAVSTSRVFLEKILMPWLGLCGIQACLLAGDGKKKQAAAMEEFRSDPNVTVMCVVKAVGSLGLNLQFAANLVIFDPHWNNALDEQAAQRIDRIGQKNRVVIRKLYMRGSVDVIMLALQRRKAKVTDAWLGRNNKKLNLSEIGMFLKEQDEVGKPRRPDAEAGADGDEPKATGNEEEDRAMLSGSRRLHRLDTLIEAEHVEEKKETHPRQNVMSRDRVHYWTDVVQLGDDDPDAGTVASRIDIEKLIFARLDQSNPIYEIPLKGRSVPFEVFNALKPLETLGDEEPTCCYMSVYPVGQSRLRTKVERVLPGSCRQFCMKDFGGHYVLQPGGGYQAPREMDGMTFANMWMLDNGEAHMCLSVYEDAVHKVELVKKVGKQEYVKRVPGMGLSVRVYSGLYFRVQSHKFKIRITNGPDVDPEIVNSMEGWTMAGQRTLKVNMTLSGQSPVTATLSVAAPRAPGAESLQDEVDRRERAYAESVRSLERERFDVELARLRYRHMKGKAGRRAAVERYAQMVAVTTKETRLKNERKELDQLRMQIVATGENHAVPGSSAQTLPEMAQALTQTAHVLAESARLMGEVRTRVTAALARPPAPAASAARPPPPAAAAAAARPPVTAWAVSAPAAAARTASPSVAAPSRSASTTRVAAHPPPSFKARRVEPSSPSPKAEAAPVVLSAEEDDVGSGSGMNPGWACPECTFICHPLLIECEMCERGQRPANYKFLDLAMSGSEEENGEHHNLAAKKRHRV